MCNKYFLKLHIKWLSSLSLGVATHIYPNLRGGRGIGSQTWEKPQTCKLSLRTFMSKMWPFLFKTTRNMWSLCESPHCVWISKFNVYPLWTNIYSLIRIYPHYIDKSMLYTQNWPYFIWYYVDIFPLLKLFFISPSFEH